MILVDILVLEKQGRGRCKIPIYDSIFLVKPRAQLLLSCETPRRVSRENEGERERGKGAREDLIAGLYSSM